MEGRWEKITPYMISKTLKADVGFCRPNLVYEDKDISACSLRATVAMSLLCSVLDSNIINLIRRCLRNEMIRYLHFHADPLMRKLY